MRNGLARSYHGQFRAPPEKLSVGNIARPCTAARYMQNARHGVTNTLKGAASPPRLSTNSIRETSGGDNHHPGDRGTYA